MRKIVILALAVVLPILAISIRAIMLPYPPACAELAEMLSDGSKVEYLRTWASERLKDRNFLTLMEDRVAVRALDEPDKLPTLNVDWNYLGLDSRFGYVQPQPYYPPLERNYVSNPTLIKSFEVGAGRKSIIVKTPNSTGWGLEGWPSNALDGLVHVHDDIVVFCNN